MKSILMSIQSPHACNILNEIKLLEIRKKFPKDYVGWVYIYVTKGKRGIFKDRHRGYTLLNQNKWIQSEMNGKVVARFWCDKVEQVFWRNLWDDEHIPYLKSCDLLKCACLCQDEFEEYVGDSESYAIHITKLEIFDKPKEISEFYNKRERMFVNNKMLYDHKFYLTRAPQSWCYVEDSL